VEADTVKVRLYWYDGRQEDAEAHTGTTMIVRQTPEGHRHFLYTGEEDEDGFARFIEEDESE
jgi:hypothetical protein